MKKIIYFALLAVLTMFISSCGKEKTKESFSIEGSWELTSVQTRSATVGSQTVYVYITFSDGNFTLYQRLGGDRFVSKTGTYQFANGLLSGKYSDGDAFGSTYTVEGDEQSMSLTTAGGSETDSYSRISSIPEFVTSSVLQSY